MGGILTNYNGQVLSFENDKDQVVNGLFACGEAACASVHGANRLGGNSLTELVVFGKAVAQAIAKTAKPGDQLPEFDENCGLESIRRIEHLLASKPVQLDSNDITGRMRAIVEKSAGVARTGTILDTAYTEIKQLFELEKQCLTVENKNMKANGELISALELKNMLANAAQVIYAAKERRESRGSQYRTDFKVTIVLFLLFLLLTCGTTQCLLFSLKERIDEYDFSKPLSDQKKKPFDKHFRKHSVTTVDHDTGNVSHHYSII
jgi:succinate dehydrogenase (ubiquinone) flavoprotein subunit